MATPEDIAKRTADTTAGLVKSAVGLGVKTAVQMAGGTIGQHAIDAHRAVMAEHSKHAAGAGAAGGAGGAGGVDHSAVLTEIAAAVKSTDSARLPAIESKLDALAAATRSTDGARARDAHDAADTASKAAGQRDELLTAIKKGLGIDEFSYTKADKDVGGSGSGDESGKGGMFGWLKGGVEGLAEKLGLTGLFKSVSGILGGVTRGLGGAAKLLGKGTLIASLADGLISGVHGFSKESAKKLLGDDSLSSRYRSAAINLLSGMTFGIASPERIRDVTTEISGWMDKRILTPLFDMFGALGDGFHAFTDYTTKAWLNLKESVTTKLVIPVEQALDWITNKVHAITHFGDKVKDGLHHFGQRVMQGLKSGAAIARTAVTHPSQVMHQAETEAARMRALSDQQARDNAHRDAQYSATTQSRVSGQQATIAGQRQSISKQQADFDKQYADNRRDRAADMAMYRDDAKAGAAAWGDTVGDISRGTEAVVRATPGALESAAETVNTAGANIGSGAYHAGHALISSKSQPATHSTGPGSSTVGGEDGKLLDAIASGESGRDGYNSVFGRRGIDLIDMTIGQVFELQRKMLAEGARSTAVGRYQFIHGTLAGLVKKLGLSMDSKFDAATQDQLALSLLDEVGRQQFKAGKISAAEYQHRIAGKWMSIADPVTGHGTHDGDGLNRASASATTMVGAALSRPSPLPSAPSATDVATDIAAAAPAGRESGSGAAAAAASAPSDGTMGDFMTLHSLPMLPTDPGLMAINVGAV